MNSVSMQLEIPNRARSRFLAHLRASATAVRPRYFVSIDSQVEPAYGFASLVEADRFIDSSAQQLGKDWRVGWLWRVRELQADLRIVDQHSNSPKGQAKKTQR